MTDYTDALADMAARMRAHDERNGTDTYTGDAAALDAVPTMAKRGTMREWMRAHDSRMVRTVQMTMRLVDCPAHDACQRGELIDVWTPGERMVDATTRAGAVFLNGSARDYAGCRVIASDADVLAVATPWGDGREQVIVYRAVAR